MTSYTHEQLTRARIHADAAPDEARDQGNLDHARLWSETLAGVLGLPLTPAGDEVGRSAEGTGEQRPCARCTMREAVALDRMGNKVCPLCHEELKDAPLSTWVTSGRN